MSVQTASAIGFREVARGDAWRVDVIVDGVLRGHINRSGDEYRYFEGPCNEVIWSFAERDLSVLESRIRSGVAERASH